MSRFSRATTIRAAGTVAFALLWLTASTAEAADAEASLAKITDLNREGLRLFTDLEFGPARKKLKQALDLCESAKLVDHPIKARTHVHLGAVLIVGFNQHELGVRQFEKALAISPQIALTGDIATPELEKAFDEARKGATGATEGRSAMAARASAPLSPLATKRVGNDGGREDESDSDNESDSTARRSHKVEDDSTEDIGEREGHFVLGLMVGSGLGWASGTAELWDRPVASPGFAPAQLGHVSPSIGYWLTSTVNLALEGRFQRVAGQTDVVDDGKTYRAANYAAAGFAKLTWMSSGGSFHPFASVAAGYGRIRHLVAFTDLRTCGPMQKATCVDTVAAGPFLGGLGAGILFDLTETVGLVAALNAQTATPTFTLNLDANLGLTLRL